MHQSTYIYIYYAAEKRRQHNTNTFETNHEVHTLGFTHGVTVKPDKVLTGLYISIQAVMCTTP